MQAAILVGDTAVAQDDDQPAHLPEGQSLRPAYIFFLVLTSKTLPVTTIERYADMLSRQLSTLTTCGLQAPVSGASKYAVRVQADPNALTARGIGIHTPRHRPQ